MLGDPLWVQDRAAHAWSWPDYFAFMSRPGVLWRSRAPVWEKIAPHGSVTCTWREAEAFKLPSRSSHPSETVAAEDRLQAIAGASVKKLSR